MWGSGSWFRCFEFGVSRFGVFGVSVSGFSMFGVTGSGFRGSGFRVWAFEGSIFGILLVFGVQGFAFRVRDSWFSGFRVFEIRGVGFGVSQFDISGSLFRGSGFRASG